MNKNKGFTLLEMVSAIAITAIVTAIAIPNYLSIAAGMKIRSASRDLCSTLQQARLNAIRMNTRWAVQFNGTANYQVIDCGADNTCGTVDDVVKLPSPIPPGVAMSQTFADNQAVFNSNGTSTSGATTLTSSKGTSSVVIAPTGRISISP